MHKLLILPLAIALALAGPTLASAAPAAQATAAVHPAARIHAGHRFARHHWRAVRRMHKLARALDLSKSQRQDIRKLARASAKQLRPQRLALRESRQAFARVVPGSSRYQSATAQLTDARINLVRARVQAHAALRTKVYALLSPAQRTQLATLQAQREQRIQWMHDHRPQARDAG